MPTAYIAPIGTDPGDRSAWQDIGLTVDADSFAFTDDLNPVADGPLLAPWPFRIEWSFKVTKAQVRAVRKLYGKRTAELPKPHPPVKAIGRHGGKVQRARRSA